MVTADCEQDAACSENLLTGTTRLHAMSMHCTHALCNALTFRKRRVWKHRAVALKCYK